MPAWSGLWDNVHGTPYAGIAQRTNLQRGIAADFESRGMRAESALAIALNGIVAGGTATSTYRAIEAIADTTGMNLGGKRNVNLNTLINRVTTAADVTALNAIFDGVFAPASYPVDKGGGGGGKTMSLV